jgi:hypothetical protein
MGQKINVSVNVQVVGGLSVAESIVLEVDAVDSLDVEVDKATGGTATKKKVEVQPTGDAKKIKLFMITTKTYDGKVKYTIDGKTVPLDGPHVLIGSGAAGLLPKAPEEIEFSNEGTEKTAIKILVGRVAS